jgi:hypothetical protein
VLMKAGDAFTCDTGHEIGVAPTDMDVGLGDDWVDRISWRQSKPGNGKPAACERCGALFMFSETTETEYQGLYRKTFWVCINREWHPKLTDVARAYLESNRGFGT